MVFASNLEREKGVQLPDKLRTRADDADKCFAGPMIQVLINGGYYPAHEVWTRIGIPSEKVGKLVSLEGEKQGQWQYVVPPEKLDQIFQLPLEKFLAELMALIQPLYVPVQPMLNSFGSKPEHGFNDHRFETHVQTVTKLQIKILEMVGVEKESLETKLALFACLVHDQGNGFNRSIHSLIMEGSLASILRLSQEQLLSSPYGEAAQAAITHDEPVALAILKEVAKGVSGAQEDIPVDIDHQAFLEKYAAISSRMESVLRIADKVQAFDFNRVINERVLSPQALVDDPHFLVSSCFAFKDIELKKPQQLDISFDFSLMQEELFRAQPNLGKPRSNGEGSRLDLPADMRARFDGENPDNHYFNQLMERFWDIHFDRMVLLVTDCFRVFPQVKDIKLKFKDVDEFAGQTPDRKQKRTYLFQRDTFLLALRAINSSQAKVQIQVAAA